MHAQTDSSSTIEWYSSDTANMYVAVTGYWTAANAHVLLVVGSKSSPSSLDLSRVTVMGNLGFTCSMLDDGDSAATFNAAFSDCRAFVFSSK